MRNEADITTPGNWDVLLNGESINDRCYRANVEQGKAWCFKHNAEGRCYKDGIGAAREVLTGKVEIVPRA